MNIGILTIHSQNFGNRLQNYALQVTLISMGHGALSMERWHTHLFWLQKRLRYLLKHDRVNLFNRFDDEFVRYSKVVVGKDFVTPGIENRFDAFVIGSDQVWNPYFAFNSEVDYLPMVPSRKKIAYAASFGVDHIAHDRQRTAELLNGIPFVSMREHAGAEIVKDLTGRAVPVVLDPTLLIARESWEKIARRPATMNVDEPYIFKYVLGDDINERRIRKIATELGCKIIDVMDQSLVIGPSEFVWLALHSEAVCTDSFHASVFALLGHRPLAIFERSDAEADMSSRFDTLCQTFHLVGHRSQDAPFSLETIMGMDWDSFEDELAIQRAESFAWLSDSLARVEAARG